MRGFAQSSEAVHTFQFEDRIALLVCDVSNQVSGAFVVSLSSISRSVQSAVGGKQDHKSGSFCSLLILNSLFSSLPERRSQAP
jgi:hypothetical protein